MITRKRTLKEHLLNLSLLVFSTAIFLSLLETGLRAFRPQITYEKAPKGWYVKHPRLGFFQKAGFEGVLKTREFEHRFAINSLGLRDDEPKREADYRILMLGDSFVWGVGAGQDETYPQVLERILNSRSGDVEIDVVNAGVCRYYPFLERILYEEIAPVLDPDLVVLSLLPNDLIDTMMGRDDVTVSPDGLLVRKDAGKRKLKRILGVSFPAPFTLTGFLRLHSHLYVFIENRIALYRLARGGASGGSSESSEGFGGYRDAMDEILGEIGKLDRMSRARGQAFLVVLIPQMGRFTGDERKLRFHDYFEGEVAAYCEERSIPYMNAADYLSRAESPYELYWQLDGHLNPRGYRMLAEGLAEYIDSAGLAPPD